MQVADAKTQVEMDEVGKMLLEDFMDELVVLFGHHTATTQMNRKAVRPAWTLHENNVESMLENVRMLEPTLL